MEVIQNYLKTKKKCIILFSGLFYCGFKSLPKKVAKKLGLSLVELHDFYKPNFNEKIQTSSREYIDWDSYDAIDWNLLNKAVKETKEKGILVSGKFFPISKIKFTPDVHLHFTIQRDFCLANLERSLDKLNSHLVDKEAEIARMTEVTMPKMKKSTADQTINKFFKINEKNPELVEDVSVYIIKRLS